MGEDRLIIGLIETIVLEDNSKYKAKIDTGADSSSINISIAESLGRKKIVSHKIIRSALGVHKRPTIMIEFEFHGKKFKEKFSVSDRTDLKYKILIGKDILKKEKFIIDSNKKEKENKDTSLQLFMPNEIILNNPNAFK